MHAARAARAEHLSLSRRLLHAKDGHVGALRGTHAACRSPRRPRGAPPAGTNELDQVGKILDVLGAPPPALLAAFARRSQHAVGLRLAPRRGSSLAALVPRLAPAGLDLLGRLLAYDPAERPSAEQALRHPYFRTLRRAPVLPAPRASAVGRAAAWRGLPDNLHGRIADRACAGRPQQHARLAAHGRAGAARSAGGARSRCARRGRQG